MSDAPALTVLPSVGERPAALGAAPSTSSSGSVLSLDNADAVEIVAPDLYCAALLQDYAAPLFPAEIVTGSSSVPSWIVRFEPPLLGGDWVIELLSLVERWLESAPVPCAKVRHGSRNYLIRAPVGMLTRARAVA